MAPNYLYGTGGSFFLLNGVLGVETKMWRELFRGRRLQVDMLLMIRFPG